MNMKTRNIRKGVCHTVVHKTKGGLPVFRDDVIAKHAVIELPAHAERFHLPVLAYCFIENAFALMFGVVDDPDRISAFMKSFTRQITDAYNRRNGTRGRLWKRHSYICPIAPSNELAAMRHIERLPVVAKVARSVHQYPFSSYSVRKTIPEGGWLGRPLSFERSGDSWQQQLDAYCDFVKQIPSLEELEVIKAVMLREGFLTIQSGYDDVPPEQP